MAYTRPPNSVLAGVALKQTPSPLPSTGLTSVTIDSDIATTTSLGVVKIGSGIDIDPAGTISVSSSGPYSAGIWTPVFTGTNIGNIGLDIRTARYIKVGKLVTCIFDIKVNSIIGGSNTALLGLGGLPFISASSTGDVGSVVIPYWEFLNSNLVTLGGTVNSSDTGILLWKANSSQDSLNIFVRKDIKVNSSFSGTVTYFSAI